VESGRQLALDGQPGHLAFLVGGHHMEDNVGKWSVKLIVLVVLLLVGCSSGASQRDIQDAVQTSVAQALTALPTQTPPATLVPTDTPTATPVPTQTPEATKTLAPTPTATAIRTKLAPSPAAVATNSSASNSADDKFYTGLVKCVGGTDVARLLVGNSPGEIVETFRREVFNVMTQKQCEQYFQAPAAAIKQIHVCVLNLPEPTNGDLAEVRKSSILALADLVKIREVDYAPDGLCDPLGKVFIDDGRVAYNNAQKHLQYAQSMLDKYRREHGK
jgi:hypothetical protein